MLILFFAAVCVFNFELLHFLRVCFPGCSVRASVRACVYQSSRWGREKRSFIINVLLVRVSCDTIVGISKTMTFPGHIT